MIGERDPTSPRDEPLWQALSAMRIEPDGAALTFPMKLARQQGWAAGYAFRVIEEYRRFLYLAATAEQAVSPSEDVDAAWHLHLTYTRHYWEEMCRRILAGPLHHDPTKGGADQRDRLAGLYAATLHHYRRTFGEAPPADIWPHPSEPAEKSEGGGRGILFAAGAWMAALSGYVLLSASRAAVPKAVSLLGALVTVFLPLLILVLALGYARQRGKKGGSCSGSACAVGGGGDGGCCGDGCGGGGCSCS